MTDGPKECRDVTELAEGIIILSAVTHCYLFTSLTEKGDLLAGITLQCLLKNRWNFLLEPKREKSRSLSLDAFLTRFCSLSLSLPGLFHHGFQN